MPSVADQFAIGAGQARDALGVAAVYHCADGINTCDLTVGMTRPEYQEMSDGLMHLAANAWEVLLVAADLVISGDVYTPVEGDSVIIASGAQAGTYVLMMPEGSRYCWTWADRFQCRRKLYTKQTA